MTRGVDNHATPLKERWAIMKSRKERATDRVVKVYEIMNECYGKDFADDMILNVLYRECKGDFKALTFDEANELYEMLTRER